LVALQADSSPKVRQAIHSFLSIIMFVWWQAGCGYG
jgi:hypothetical protein